MSLKKNLDVIIFEKMRNSIIEGLWTPGTQIDIDEIARHYEVSRTPVVQALKCMQTQGMVICVSTGKFFVPSFTSQEVENICKIRQLLEIEAINELRSFKTDFSSLKRLSQKCKEATLEGDVIQSRRYDLEYHKTLIILSQNLCLQNIYEKVQGQFMVANYLLGVHSTEQQAFANNEHFELVEAFEKGQYDSAIEIMKNHMKFALTNLLERMN